MSSALKAGSAVVVARGLRGTSLLAQQPSSQPQPAAATGNIIQIMRNAGAMTPVKVTPLRDNIALLQGVGGNMVALTGPDGKLLIDSSVDTATQRVNQALGTLGTQPLRLLINTHWHFDHTDGNAGIHDAGALILAHENTRLRMSRPQRMEVLQVDFPAARESALPNQVFADNFQIFFNKDTLSLVHFAPAHTDSDISIFFKNGNVLHAGDIWFNNFYPLIDNSSGGRIEGMIQASTQLITSADSQTKIVPGHGPLGDKAGLTEYRDMLVAVRDRVDGLKRGGRTMAEAVAAKPTADLDGKWGKGSITPATFVQLVYMTLPEGHA